MEERAKKFNHYALNFLRHLEEIPEVVVDFKCPTNGVLTHECNIWERKNSNTLPEDLKAFYSMFNGFCLSWFVEIAGVKVNVGELRVNGFDEVKQVVLEGEYFFRKKPSVQIDTLGLSNAYVIDSSSEIGNIILVFRNKDICKEHEGPFNRTEIWLQDNSSRCHFICYSFTQYMRLMIVHFGILGWQLAYTPEGLSVVTMQWMNMFCRERLLTDLYSNEVVEC